MLRPAQTSDRVTEVIVGHAKEVPSPSFFGMQVVTAEGIPDDTLLMGYLRFVGVDVSSDGIVLRFSWEAEVTVNNIRREASQEVLL